MQRRANKLFIKRLAETAIAARPGMIDLLAAAKADGLKLTAIASMKEEAARLLLKKALGEGISAWFDHVVTPGDEPGNNPEFFALVLSRLELPAEKCLVIEGTVSAARAARSVGLAAVTTRSSSCAECYSESDPLVIEDLPSLIANSDKRRLDPLTPDERAELLTVLDRLHAGNFDTGAYHKRSSAMRVSDILKTKGSAVKTIDAKASIRSLARALRNESVGVMVVTDASGGLKGIISERDLARGLADFGNDLSAMSVADLMTTAVVTCMPDDSVANVARVMTVRRVRHLPVMAGSKLVGLISIGDVLKYRLDEVQLEANVLRDVAIARG